VSSLIGVKAYITAYILAYIPVAFFRATDYDTGMETTRTIQGSLFQLPPIDPEKVRTDLEPVSPDLWDLMMGVWRDFLDYREQDPNFQGMEEYDIAEFVTSLAYRRAKKMASDDGRMKVERLNGKYVLIVLEKYEMKIKKLTSRRIRAGGPIVMTRSNYQTPTNLAYYNQDQAVGSGLDLPRIILGYQLVDETSDIRLLIAYPRSKTRAVLWFYELPKSEGITRPRLAESATAAESHEVGFEFTVNDDEARSSGTDE
jgi:hypothetical protein